MAADQTRRVFLQHSAGALTILPWFGSPLRAATSRRARSPGSRTLVVVELVGGNDGLNTIVPIRDERYHEARPTLRLDPKRAHSLDDETALHPAMEPLLDTFQRSELAIVQSVGSPEPDRSHFRARDIWHTARMDPENASSGWLGRAVEQFGDRVDLPALVVGQNEVPLLLRGSRQQPPALRALDDLLPPDRDTRRGAARRRALEELAEVPSSNARTEALREATARAHVQIERLHAATADGAGEPVAESRLGRELGWIAGLIRAEYACPLYYVAHGGYDTHAAQAPSHENLLRELADGLAGFQDRLRECGATDRTLTVVFSEFGRRVRENGSRGTDHGAGAPGLLLSSALEAGIHGGGVLDDLLDGDVRPRVDFRALASTVLEGWWKLPSDSLLGDRFAPLPLL